MYVPLFFFHLDCQVIIINEPFSHFFIPSVSVSLYFLSELILYFFCIRLLKHLDTCSRWRLTLSRTFIFSELFHFWVQSICYMFEIDYVCCHWKSCTGCLFPFENIFASYFNVVLLLDGLYQMRFRFLVSLVYLSKYNQKC